MAARTETGHRNALSLTHPQEARVGANSVCGLMGAHILSSQDGIKQS